MAVPLNMQNLYRYRILRNLRLVIQFHQGPVEFQPLLSLKQKLLEDPDFDASYPLILDFRRADILMNLPEVMHYRDLLEEMYRSRNIISSKCATLVSSPRTTAISVSFADTSFTSNIHYRVFSCMDSATQWLGINPQQISIIENNIEQLARETS